jgi:hypothetical protein
MAKSYAYTPISAHETFEGRCTEGLSLLEKYNCSFEKYSEMCAQFDFDPQLSAAALCEAVRSTNPLQFHSYAVEGEWDSATQTWLVEEC